MKGLVLVLCLAAVSQAANPVVKVLDSRTFRLQDGTTVRLANVEEQSAATNRKQATIVLQLWLLDREVKLSNQAGGEWDGVVVADVVWRGLNIGDQMVKKGYLRRPGAIVEPPAVEQPQPQPVRRYRVQSQPTYQYYQGSSFYPYQSPMSGTVCVGNT